MMSTPLEELRDELAALSERVALLETRTADRQPTTQRPDAETPPPEETFWALDALRARRDLHDTIRAGVVMLVGSVTLPDGSPVEWQQGTATEDLLEVEWSDRAAAFAALGHPVRVELLRHILNGTRTTAALAEVEGLGTTGQLHHHLRQLVTAGWVRQTARGRYDVPAAKIVPLLVCLTGVS